MTNSTVGVSTRSVGSTYSRSIRTLTVDTCSFLSNTRDIRVKFLPNAGSTLRLVKNDFWASSPVDIWGAAPGEPTVPLFVAGNYFNGLPVGWMFALTGGFIGPINANNFRGAENGTLTVALVAYSDTQGLPYPD